MSGGMLDLVKLRGNCRVRVSGVWLRGQVEEVNARSLYVRVFDLAAKGSPIAGTLVIKRKWVDVVVDGAGPEST